MIHALLLAAALSHPAGASRHELTGALGFGVRETQPILVVSWTGRARWGAWFRVDQEERSGGPTVGNPEGTQVGSNAGSIGVAWRALPRLTVGVGYGEKQETTTVYGSIGGLPIVLEDHKDTEHGLAAIGTWTFPVNETLGVAVSATGGPGGFGAAGGVTFYF